MPRIPAASDRPAPHGRAGLIVAICAIALGIGCLGAVIAVLAADTRAADPEPDTSVEQAAEPRSIKADDTVTRSEGIIETVDEAWADEAAGATGIPKRALLAYAGAARCAFSPLGSSTLRVESR